MYGLLGILVMIISAYLFKKAAGGLSILKLNLINMVYYSMFIFQGIGTCLIAFGFREHYLIKKVNIPESFDKAYLGLSIAMLLIPIVVILFNKKKNINIKQEYDLYIKKRIINNDSDRTYKIILILTFISIVTIIYVMCYIGYVPLFKMFFGNINFATERINISRGFAGNQYIRNLLGNIMIPFLSYISYTYARSSKKKKWIIPTVILIICSILMKTSDFAKSPLVMYIATFILIEILLNKISFKKIMLVALVGMSIIIGSYISIGGYNGKYLSLTNGPLSRTLITQTGTMILHFDAFPTKNDYLYGSSFPKEIGILFGAKQENIRSARKVMEIYNRKAVQNGTAGVMNTLYIGEAYANFGFIGIIFSSIWIGLVLAFIMKKLIYSKKTALNIALYSQVSMILVSCLQGGVIDYFYNIAILFILFIYFSIYFTLKREHEFKLTNSIIYINFVDLNSTKSGSSVRPKKIYDELVNEKFNIEMLTGMQNRYKERWRNCIKFLNKIRKNDYDICYIEPPAGPIFNLCDHLLIIYISLIKKIPVGLFYRDAYWKLADWYDVKGIKGFVLKLMHRSELFLFRICCKKIYFASESVSLEFPFKNRDVLSPGCDNRTIEKEKNIFNQCIYVGGVSERYGTEILLEAFNIVNSEYNKNITLNLVCREEIDIISKYKSEKWINLYLGVSGEALLPIYNKSDIAIIPFKKERYMDYAIPIKLLEYIENEIPIVSTNCNELEKFINKYKIGEVTKDKPSELAKAIVDMYNSNLDKYIENIKLAKNDNLWKEKILKIYSDLTS